MSKRKRWMEHMTPEHQRDLTALRRRASKARHFPTNTCPSSRHLHIAADCLIKYGRYVMFEEDPVHCAESILAVIASLWEARTQLAKAEKEQKDG